MENIRKITKITPMSAAKALVMFFCLELDALFCLTISSTLIDNKDRQAMEKGVISVPIRWKQSCHKPGIRQSLQL